MTPAGAKAIPSNPVRFNLLARPVTNGCRICGFPGHSSANVKASTACRVAILSLIGFWEDVAAHVSFLYRSSDRFQKAIVANKPKYEMRLDDGGLKGGDLEDVLVERLTRGWLKFLAHFARIRAKANVMLSQEDLGAYEVAVRNLSGFLLDGMTCKFALLWGGGHEVNVLQCPICSSRALVGSSRTSDFAARCLFERKMASAYSCTDTYP
jgi:CCR4-NOT transcription complex subunit 2